ncbi:AraC family transcriptional regulator [Arcobacter roscoffensis]|uniref:GyrI-like domain-containing protein n=1 Tax=Arcobacter roscoffensis TaxID=2961520 RepID=A0ABY5E6B0_9BACT|nr:GyrI-like domain-containing protein [Arcobacter roscoffensis]UTJ07266.1 GyrI-like domain-containing protein [Arcobacter roscoffensis]
MKKDTKHIRADIVNKSLTYIYKYIDTNITLDELARLNKVSKFHLHRIFKEETGENIFDRINSIRLQKIANLLISNKYSTISEIRQSCGYSSHSSFIKAFKKRFNFTPSQWKKNGYLEYSKKIVSFDISPNDNFYTIEPIIKKTSKRVCAYIRHKGYDLSVTKTWSRLMAFSYEKELNNTTQIGVFYDNPINTAYEECSYIAAIEVDNRFISTNSISKLEIEGSLCAVFHYEGIYGDAVKLLVYIYNYWLPKSGYEAKSLPPYALYHKNHFLDENREFSLDFYIPIQVV